MGKFLLRRLGPLLPLALVFTACESVRPPAILTGESASCPFEDASFCEFVLELENTLDSQDGEAFLEDVLLRDCEKYGHGFHGPVPEDFCGSAAWCIERGGLLGEPTCSPQPLPASLEDILGDRYLSIRGIVYPGLRFLEGNPFSGGPMIVLETVNPEADRALVAKKDEAGWEVVSIHTWRPDPDNSLAPPEIIVPWERQNGQTLAWLGMQMSLRSWKVGDHPWDAETDRYGVLAHRTLDACRLSLLAQDPYALAGRPQDWNRAALQGETEKLRVNLFRYSDPDGVPVMSFYEIFDITGREVNAPVRLGYFLHEAPEPSEECTEAFQLLLPTLDPARFPDLPVAQG